MIMDQQRPSQGLGIEEMVRFLTQDDAASRRHRAERACEMMALLPVSEDGFLLRGGEETVRALVEVRLTYVNGLFLATVLTAIALIERQIAGLLYGAGLESAKRMSLEDLLKRAERNGWLRTIGRDEMDRFREVRNSYAHFREPGHGTSGMRRALNADKTVDVLIREDARIALKILGLFLAQQHSSL